MKRLNIIQVIGGNWVDTQRSSIYIDQFLRAHAAKTGFPSKVGVSTDIQGCYLGRFPEELVRVNYSPLNTDTYARYFWELYDKFADALSSTENLLPEPTRDQFRRLLSYYILLQERVDAAIIGYSVTRKNDDNESAEIVEEPALTVLNRLFVTKDRSKVIQRLPQRMRPNRPVFSVAQDKTVSEAMERLSNLAAFPFSASNGPWDETDRKPIYLAEAMPSYILDIRPTQPLQKQAFNALRAARSFLSETRPAARDTIEPREVREAFRGYDEVPAWKIIEREGDPRKWFLHPVGDHGSLGSVLRWFKKQTDVDAAKRFVIFDQLDLGRSRGGVRLLSQMLPALNTPLELAKCCYCNWKSDMATGLTFPLQMETTIDSTRRPTSSQGQATATSSVGSSERLQENWAQWTGVELSALPTIFAALTSLDARESNQILIIGSEQLVARASVLLRRYLLGLGGTSNIGMLS